MDFSSLRDQVSNLTLYDIKAGVRKVQNAVMNYTEMEAKVREATNNEPWGASSTLMNEIASGTFSYQLLNEIMPMIYRRFTDKSAEEWRQIYKALQLLEFLVKNGSERVVDDARSHLGLLRMLRQFHYIDTNGKDQGINVRNRAKELAELLSDVDKIRSERKKARANKNKFGGVEGGLGGSGFSGSGSRYGGFGSEDAGYGGYSGGVYGDGGGFGGNTDHSFATTQSHRDRFEEYDEYDEGAVAAPGRRKADVAAAAAAAATSSSSRPGVRRSTAEPSAPKKKPEPVEDLFSFDAPAAAASSRSNGKKPITNAMSSSALDDFGTLQSSADDDFDDFQSAPPISAAATATTATSTTTAIAQPTSFQPIQPMTTSTTTSTTQFVAPKPVSAQRASNITDLFSSISSVPSSTASTPAPLGFSAPPLTKSSTEGALGMGGVPITGMNAPKSASTGYQATAPNYYASVSTPLSPTHSSMQRRTESISSTGSASRTATVSAASKADPFSSLWSSASAKSGIKKTDDGKKGGPSLQSLAHEKASQGIWGQSTGASTASGSHGQTGSGMGDLLG